ncbi:MAG: carboxypeptidase-like regulatory domain-containing protein, partial [Bryobacteraceae bacterium]
MAEVASNFGGKCHTLQRWQTAVILGLILFFCLSRPTWAQSTTDTTKRAATNAGEIRGRIVALGTAQGIATGSISVRRASDSSVVSGANAESDGSFHIAGLKPGRYSIRVRAVGFAP